MKFDLSRIWQSKHERRRRLAALPFEEKLRTVERLREGIAAIAASSLRRSKSRDSGKV